MTYSVQLILTATLAANRPRPGDWSFGWTTVATIAEVALAIIVCLWAMKTYFFLHRERQGNSPWRLFADLCLAQNLSRRERRILTRLAGHHELDQPAMLFVEPSWWDVPKLGPQWANQKDELNRLKNRLFSSR